MRDYYEILGVSKTATAQEIKAAFRKLAQEHHPDKGGDMAKFKEANEAYQILSDTDKRAAYDRFGHAGAQHAGAQGGGFGGFSGAQGFDFNGDLGDLFEGLGDVFGFGGGRGARGGAKRGGDIEVEIQVSFRDAAFGIERTIELEKMNTCDTCEGTGAQKESKTKTCGHCKGQGFVIATVSTFFGAMQQQVMCNVCHGRKTVPEKPCTSCTGRGARRFSKKIKITIPAGVDTGAVLKVLQEGEALGVHGASGDLYVHIRVASDAQFTRVGMDIHANLAIPFTSAILGESIDVPTLHGDVVLKVPAGTQPGAVLRLKGKGVHHRHGQGDHYITIQVKIPEKISKKQREALNAYLDG